MRKRISLSVGRQATVVLLKTGLHNRIKPICMMLTAYLGFPLIPSRKWMFQALISIKCYIL